MVVSVLLGAAGVVELVADPLHIGNGVLDVLDKRAGIVGMLLGAAGLVVSVWGLRPARVAEPSPPSATGPSSSGPGSPVVGGCMSGGMVVGQVTGGHVIGPGAVSASGDRAVGVGGGAGVVMTGDGASFTMTTVAAAPTPAPLPATIAVGLPPGGMVALPRVPARVFVGRDDRLRALDEALQVGAGVIAQAVIGLGGVGKSELALQYAHRRRQAYDLVWWVTAEDAERIQASLAGLCRELCRRHGGQAAAAARQAPTEEAAAWARAWLAGTPARWLVVFDNVEDIDHVHPLLGWFGTGHVLVTTRRDIGWEDLAATVIRLDVLTRTAAVELLLDVLGPGAASEVEAVGELAGELDGLPLALKQAAAYIARTPGMTVVAYLDLLRTDPHRALSADPRRTPTAVGEEVVARVWAITCDRIAQLNPLAIRVLQVLACYAPDDLPCSVLEGIDGADSAEVADVLGLLASYSMITPSPDGQAVTVHRLVQTVTLADLSDDQRAELRRTAAGLLHAALPSDPKDISFWPTYARLLPHARAALPPGSPGMGAVIDYLKASGDYRTAKTLQQHRTTALRTTLGPEHPGTLIDRASLAYCTGESGDLAEARALFAELVPLIDRVFGPQHPNTLIARANLAYFTGRAGDAARARDLYTKLVPLMEQASGPQQPLTLIARSNLAMWTGDAGDVAGARDLFAELVPLMEQAWGPEHPDMLIARANLANFTGRAGDAARARDLYTELVPLMERVLSPEHPLTLRAQSDLPHWTRHAAMRDGYTELVPLMDRMWGPEHPLTLIVRLAQRADETGDAAVARDLYTELVPVRERLYGPEHPLTLIARSLLAQWTGKAGQAAAARDLYAPLLPLMERVLGPEHSDTLTARSNLAYWTER